MIVHEPGLSTIKYNDLTVILEQMIESGWIRKFPSPHSKNIMVYTLEEKGREVANTIKEIQEKNSEHPLMELETFYDVKVLEPSND